MEGCEVCLREQYSEGDLKDLRECLAGMTLDPIVSKPGEVLAEILRDRARVSERMVLHTLADSVKHLDYTWAWALYLLCQEVL